MKKSIVTICTLWFLLTTLSYAYQFEDYTWGTPYDKVLSQLKEKNKNIITSSNKEINYNDKIFDKSCQVGLLFTPKTKLLATVAIQWKDTNVGIDLKNLLTEKYGMPVQPNQFIDVFIWGNYPEKDCIILNYAFFETLVFYNGSEYEKMREKENEEIISTESNRF